MDTNTLQNLGVQINNMSMMVNNLVNRINIMENSLRIIQNRQDTILNTLTRNVSNPNPNNTDRRNTTNASPYRYYTSREPVYEAPYQGYNNSTFPRDTSNLRRQPIRRERPQHPIPMRRQTNNPPPNPFSLFNNTPNSTSTSIGTNLPTLNQPDVRRTYNSDGSLDTVEMTFTNVISDTEMANLFPNLSGTQTSRTNPRISPRISPRMNVTNNTTTTGPRLINTMDDARVFLNLLDTLSNSPGGNNSSAPLSLRDINQHTSISHYNPRVNRRETTEEPLETEEHEASNNGNTDSDNMCVICRCPFENGDIIRTLNNCNHRFHRNCIDSWLEIRNTCPVCRHHVTEPRIENNTVSDNNNTTETTNQEESVEINQLD